MVGYSAAELLTMTYLDIRIRMINSRDAALLDLLRGRNQRVHD
jgi:hypothetical protein